MPSQEKFCPRALRFQEWVLDEFVRLLSREALSSEDEKVSREVLASSFIKYGEKLTFQDDDFKMACKHLAGEIFRAVLMPLSKGERENRLGVPQIVTLLFTLSYASSRQAQSEAKARIVHDVISRSSNGSVSIDDFNSYVSGLVRALYILFPELRAYARATVRELYDEIVIYLRRVMSCQGGEVGARGDGGDREREEEEEEEEEEDNVRQEYHSPPPKQTDRVPGTIPLVVRDRRPSPGAWIHRGEGSARGRLRCALSLGLHRQAENESHG